MRAEIESRRAWLTALLCFAAMFVTVGTGFSYGGLVLPASRDLGVGQGAVSGVFAVTVMVFFLMGVPAGMLADRYGARAVLLLGTVALGAGLAVTAMAESVLALYLGHGVLVGTAMSTSFIPLTALVSALFVRHRALAVGVSVSGIGLGTLVMAPLLAASTGLLGWRETYLGLAVAASVVLLCCAVLLGAPPRRGSAPARVSDSVTTTDYRVLYLAQLLVSVAIFTPFAHLPAFAESSGVPAVAAAGLVGLIGAASVAGRLALGPVASRIGLFRTYRTCYAAVGLSFATWFLPGVGHTGLAVHAVVLGVGYGGFVALLPAVVAHRFGLDGLGGLLGVLYTSHVIGAGFGPLATGLLIERSGYLPAATVALVCGLAGAVVLGRVDRQAMTGTGSGQGSPSRR